DRANPRRHITKQSTYEPRSPQGEFPAILPSPLSRPLFWQMPAGLAGGPDPRLDVDKLSPVRLFFGEDERQCYRRFPGRLAQSPPRGSAVRLGTARVFPSA